MRNLVLIGRSGHRVIGPSGHLSQTLLTFDGPMTRWLDDPINSYYAAREFPRKLQIVKQNSKAADKSVRATRKSQATYAGGTST
jgi:hypothetical protein